MMSASHPPRLRVRADVGSLLGRRLGRDDETLGLLRAKSQELRAES